MDEHGQRVLSAAVSREVQQPISASVAAAPARPSSASCLNRAAATRRRPRQQQQPFSQETTPQHRVITLRPSFLPPACLSLARPSSFVYPTVLLYCCGCTVSSAKTSAADLLLGACRPTERHSPCISSEQTTVISVPLVVTTQVARGHGSSSIRAAVRSSCSSRISIIPRHSRPPICTFLSAILRRSSPTLGSRKCTPRNTTL